MRVAAWKDPGMAAVGREPCIGQQSQVPKSELYRACIYCVLGKLALDLYAVLGIFPTDRQLSPPLVHCKVSVWSWVNIDVLTWCAWHLVGRCTLYETLAKASFGRGGHCWKSLLWAAKKLFQVLQQWQEGTIMADGQHWNSAEVFFPRVLPGIYDPQSLFGCFPDI